MMKIARHAACSAKKSLSAANWAGELMKGSTKFASSRKASVDGMLQTETVGLVTYDDYKRKKEALEALEHAELNDEAAGEGRERQGKAPGGCNSPCALQEHTHTHTHIHTTSGGRLSPFAWQEETHTLAHTQTHATPGGRRWPCAL